MAALEQPHILIVDDDRQIRTMLARYLGDNGMRVTTAEHGGQMRELVGKFRFDTVVLDVMMPGDDGFILCQRLRSTSTVPIILLTARGGETDRIIGLELGADDYIPKPFNPRELLARIRSALRRVAMAAAPQQSSFASRYRFAGWMLDVSRRTLTSPAGSLVELTTGEFDLLVALVQHPQQVLSRDQLLDYVHGRSSINIDRSIDVQVSRLRRKVERDPQSPALIKTVRNGGYFFTTPVEPQAAA